MFDKFTGDDALSQGSKTRRGLGRTRNNGAALKHTIGRGTAKAQPRDGARNYFRISTSSTEDHLLGQHGDSRERQTLDELTMGEISVVMQELTPELVESLYRRSS